MDLTSAAIFVSPRLSSRDVAGIARYCNIVAKFSEFLPYADPESHILQSWLNECVTRGIVNFIAVGGDGTLHLLANAMQVYAARSPAVPPLRLGCVGYGSSNDFVKGESGTIKPRLDWGRAKQMPVALFSSAMLRRYMFVGASIGVTAYANKLFNVQRGPTDRWVGFRILWCAIQALIKFKPYKMGIRIDQLEIVASFNKIGISSQRAFAGSFRYDRTPVPGSMGIWLCLNMNLWQSVCTMFDFSRGVFREDSKRLYMDCQRICLDADEDFVLELDGETYSCKNCEMKVEQSRIYICPKDDQPHDS